MSAPRRILPARLNLKLRETLRNQAIRDPLTGLYNRRYLEETLEREFLRSQRNGQSVGVIMLDVDHFKRYNDTNGHRGGDAVLRELGMLISSMVRGTDVPCRYGGEEFIILMPDAPAEICAARAEELRLAAKRMSIQLDGAQLQSISISLGVAASARGGRAAQLVQAADAALYAAKHAGRDQVCVARAPESEAAGASEPRLVAVGGGST